MINVSSSFFSTEVESLNKRLMCNLVNEIFYS